MIRLSPTQRRILAHVAAAPGCSVTELAEALGLARGSTLYSTVARLRLRGYLAARAHGTWGGRAQEMALTATAAGRGRL